MASGRYTCLSPGTTSVVAKLEEAAVETSESSISDSYHVDEAHWTTWDELKWADMAKWRFSIQVVDAVQTVQCLDLVERG